MIQYSKDGTSLFYTDTSGQIVEASVYDTKEFSAMRLVMDEQAQAGRDNALTLNEYNAKLGAIQGSIDVGRYDNTPAPVKPQMKVVSNTGDVSYAPFSPALGDLKFPVITPSSGLIAAPSIDKQAIMFNIIEAMFRKMFPPPAVTPAAPAAAVKG